jgi:hypothetical protein
MLWELFGLPGIAEQCIIRATTNTEPSIRGNPLDHTGVDIVLGNLRDWANNPGGRTLSSGASPNFFAFYDEGMMAYYCINAPNTSGNLDLNDVNYALVQMDSHCAPYTASFFEWPGSYEIVGKCAQTTAVCLGGLEG